MLEREAPLFCIDMGTTRTRVWLTEGQNVLAYQTGNFGARDTAIHHDKQWLAGELSSLMEQTFRSSGNAAPFPHYAVAAGMITSSQGLQEIPHVNGPAGAKEIAAGMSTVKLTPNLSLLLVPGVLTGTSVEKVDDLSQFDIMRGEETLCIGLLENGMIQKNTPLLHLGSHWKWIFINDTLRISGSRTSLTGEMIHAVQANTLLSASLPDGRPNQFDIEWVERGLSTSQSEGLARSLFCVRLLHLHGVATSVQRISFLYGAFLAQEVQFVEKHLHLRDVQVLISGHGALANLWRQCLQKISVSAVVLDEAARESAYLNGLRILAERSGLLM